MIICMPTGLDSVFEKNKYGRFDYSQLGHESEIAIASQLVDTFNASKIIFTTGEKACIALIKENLVDFIATARPIFDEDEYYHVPHAIGMSHLDIMTGYDFKEYSKVFEKGEEPKLGILSNYKSFDFIVYLYLLILLIILFTFAGFIAFVKHEKYFIFRRKRCFNFFLHKLKSIIKYSY